MIIQISEDFIFSFKNKKHDVKKGIYLYVGSAFGSGGLTSRLHRHIRKQKKSHWHIDYITIKKEVEIVGILIYVNQKIECHLAQKLNQFKLTIPIIGFGSSDCKNKCQSHFFKID